MKLRKSRITKEEYNNLPNVWDDKGCINKTDYYQCVHCYEYVIEEELGDYCCFGCDICDGFIECKVCELTKGEK